MSARDLQSQRPAAQRAITVLMYHAVVDDSELADADPHYAVTATAFATQLDMFVRVGRRPTSVQRVLNGERGAAVALTFDDGHASDVRAAEMIAGCGGAADFFVNPSTVGSRGRLSWAELRSLSELGMSIQSHGFTHRYLDALSPADVRAELADSKRSIEDGIGRAVELFAPPGGRMPPDLPRLAQMLGYRAVCSSRVGAWAGTLDSAEVPRMPVLGSTSLLRLQQWVEQDPAALAAARLRHITLTAAKRLLPRSVYEGVRGALTRVPRGGARG
jgi:peptidoglycan/xylan/chitin deacetylase (PgdA/CDA1 family)